MAGVPIAAIASDFVTDWKSTVWPARDQRPALEQGSETRTLLELSETRSCGTSEPPREVKFKLTAERLL